jgi:hypothetical protein
MAVKQTHSLDEKKQSKVVVPGHGEPTDGPVPGERGGGPRE